MSITLPNWPGEHISLTCYLNQIVNYRYHWHENEYEIDIILKGREKFIVGTNAYTLTENDFIIVNPGEGHASFNLADETVALVIRFTEEAFLPYTGLKKRIIFNACSSAESTPINSSLKNKILYYATLLLDGIQEDTPVNELKTKTSLQNLIITIADSLNNQIIPIAKEDLFYQKTIRFITSYIENNYSEKITLEELAEKTQYNRTYLSTLFSKILGIKFYDYLTRIRLQNALFDLRRDDITLTEIAINNGFPDLKNFNKKFKEIFHVSASEYRKSVQNMSGLYLEQGRVFRDPDDKELCKILLNWKMFL